MNRFTLICFSFCLNVLFCYGQTKKYDNDSIKIKLICIDFCDENFFGAFDDNHFTLKYLVEKESGLFRSIDISDSLVIKNIISGKDPFGNINLRSIKQISERAIGGTRAMIIVTQGNRLVKYIYIRFDGSMSRGYFKISPSKFLFEYLVDVCGCTK